MGMPYLDGMTDEELDERAQGAIRAAAAGKAVNVYGYDGLRKLQVRSLNGLRQVVRCTYETVQSAAGGTAYVSTVSSWLDAMDEGAWTP